MKTSPTGVVEKVAWLPFTDAQEVIFARSIGQTTAYNIGGKIEPGETLENALIREAKEEADVDLIPESIRLLFFHEGPCHGYVEGTKLRMHCYSADYTGVLKPSSEVEELVHLSRRDIGTGKTTAMGDQILEKLAADNLLK